MTPLRSFLHSGATALQGLFAPLPKLGVSQTPRLVVTAPDRAGVRYHQSLKPTVCGFLHLLRHVVASRRPGLNQ